MAERVCIALLLSTAAGLSTTLGSLLGVVIRRPGPRFMGFTLGFSAGVMILVSFVELLQGSIQAVGFLSAHVAFFLGMLGLFVLDFLIPHEYIGQREYREAAPSTERLRRTGVLLALGIGIHNFPEGMATFVGALKDVHVGLAIAIAVAIHNIPEGLAVSAPVYAATGSRRKAVLWSFLSGVSEPVGAALAALLLMPFLTDALLGLVLAAVAGVMVAISLDELVPAAKAYGSAHTPIVGLIAGMAVMAASLWLLQYR
jgi:ZIP family zinc transporter